MLKLSDYYEKLRKFNWASYDVYYAILFGSLAKKGEGNDLDIAVEFKRKSLEAYSKLYSDLVDYLGIEEVDLAIITDETDCFFIHEVFNNSLILHLEDYIRMHRRVIICEDFLIDVKKLNTIENSARALLRKWNL
ncbi:nucleotidyltransferase domain-containing protein [Saccharolobus solfataricus]|uniref:Polymerase beta nucleotidyltransferase domain-containing protein n=2 Tax=Saccharolobus solfataricus TaxID=2287 RepID=Q97UQ4_SACS2|nr:nucleotidyltransferase domain-containing protein [Saccharolobus solfataricus]AAK43054.1 Hypothetical protein SSO2952 [Saccharolobus solfataricus P2]QPG50105.1 nucleotidyltransferase domain-containing protein [Saccharolobus solfataricus]SAI86603.1 uncharacterised protein [Saccharolobus solfataricus]